jgi:hypothetical protein
VVTKAKVRKATSRRFDKNNSQLHVTGSEAGTGPFRPGAIVLVTLNNPREKFWGVILGLSAEGLGLRGIELSSFDDTSRAFAAGEPLPAAALFFPMHRVERIELDLPVAALPSLSEQFASRTGVEAERALSQAISRQRRAGA